MYCIYRINCFMSLLTKHYLKLQCILKHHNAVRRVRLTSTYYVGGYVKDKTIYSDMFSAIVELQILKIEDSYDNK